MHPPDTPVDYLRAFLALIVHERARASHPAVAAWTKETRLNPLSELGKYREDPLVVQTREILKQSGVAAGNNLAKLLS